MLFAARDVERDHGSTLSVLKSLYMDGMPTNIYQWRLRHDSVVTQVVNYLVLLNGKFQYHY